MGLMYQRFWSSNPPCRSLFCSGFVGEFDSDLYLIHQYIGTFFPFTLDAQEAPLLVITDYNATERLGGATYHCTSRQTLPEYMPLRFTATEFIDHLCFHLLHTYGVYFQSFIGLYKGESL